MADPAKNNLTWHASKVSAQEREQLIRQKGAVIWFTGLSGSGKSTVAREVEALLVRQGRNAFVLDGDNIRHGLNQDLNFSPDHRAENIRRIAEVAKLFQQANVLCLTAFVSPYRKDRDHVRAALPEGRFVEVYCAATLAQCEARDPKGLYRKARAGQIPDFTGISAPYEAPRHPELVLQTGTESLASCTSKVISHLIRVGLL